MNWDYEVNPQRIEQESFRQIRSLLDLSRFSREESQVVMRIVHSLGCPRVTNQIRFSEKACRLGCKALAQERPILCDAEMVKQGITKRMVVQPPHCFLNDRRVAGWANEANETRSMAALKLWVPYLEGSVVVIGNAPTVLFRLLEMLRDGAPRPSLIIGMPVGFVGAAESKQALWGSYAELGVECITLLGNQGGSSVSAASCNALLRCNHGEWY